MKGLAIHELLSIPSGDLSWSAARSSGPGGQNVNKVATKVILRFDLDGTAALTQAQKRRLRKLAGRRLDANGGNSDQRPGRALATAEPRSGARKPASPDSEIAGRSEASRRNEAIQVAETPPAPRQAPPKREEAEPSGRSRRGQLALEPLLDLPAQHGQELLFEPRVLLHPDA